MVGVGRLTFVCVALVMSFASCRDEELILFRDYRSGLLHTDMPRPDGYYYSHQPSCGDDRQANEVVFFYEDGSLLHNTWAIDTDLAHFEARMKSSRRYVVDKGHDTGFGWGLGCWRQDTVFAEHFSHATRARLRVGRWVAKLSDGGMTMLSYSTPNYPTYNVDCSTKFSFRVCTWKPDPAAFFERDKQFIRSQEYFIRRNQRK